ncbi:hypothetical protein [Desulfovibrio inopinatus]|uniref:hypothetical protein n=1 Tax=Desulfovibrio inopinatus TaxID=102109 RepID=UPI0004008E52|nr:hypothetical protein [Desulfovibrio inopinatus]
MCINEEHVASLYPAYPGTGFDVQRRYHPGLDDFDTTSHDSTAACLLRFRAGTRPWVMTTSTLSICALPADDVHNH